MPLPTLNMAVVARVRSAYPELISPDGAIEVMRQLAESDPVLEQVIAKNVMALLHTGAPPQVVTAFGVGCCFVYQLLSAASSEPDVAELERMFSAPNSGGVQ